MTSNITPEDAEEYSQSLAQIGEGWWRQIAWAFRQGMHEALGMSRREWAEKYHGYFRMPIEERREAVAELASEGMSQPEIADTLGVGLATVNRDLHANDAPPFQTESQGPPVGAEQEASDSNDAPPFQTESPESADEERDDIHAILEGEPDPGDETMALLEAVEEDLPEATEEPEPEPRIQVNEGDEWYTPRWLFNALGIQFSMDVCAPLDQTFSSVPADRHLTIEDDGLSQPWEGTIWCNPPYSKPEPWARRLIHHGDGLLLTHMPMNAGWCVDVWEACDAIRLFQAMEFVRPDGTSQRPGYWLQLAAFGPVATEALARLQPLGEAAANKRRVASPMWRRSA